MIYASFGRSSLSPLTNLSFDAFDRLVMLALGVVGTGLSAQGPGSVGIVILMGILAGDLIIQL